MIKFNSLIPNAEDLISLEPEELAYFVLEYLNSLTKESSLLNRFNFCRSNIIDDYPPQYKTNIMESLTEAWMWLIREGFLAPKPDANTGEWVFITRRGQKIKNKSDFQNYQNANLLPKQLLHPLIASKVYPVFLRGDYDTTVFIAFKEIEIAVRKAAKLSNEDYGVKLTRKAFHKVNGPLRDPSNESNDSEKEALDHLFI